MPADEPPSSQATIAHCPTCRSSLVRDLVTEYHVESLRQLLVAVQDTLDDVRDYLLAEGEWDDA